jgi:hypothetical protein
VAKTPLGGSVLESAPDVRLHRIYASEDTILAGHRERTPSMREPQLQNILVDQEPNPNLPNVLWKSANRPPNAKSLKELAVASLPE